MSQSTKFLIAGLGSIGRRHFRNLIALGETDIVLLRSHRATLSDELAGYPVETDSRRKHSKSTKILTLECQLPCWQDIPAFLRVAVMPHRYGGSFSKDTNFAPNYRKITATLR